MRQEGALCREQNPEANVENYGVDKRIDPQRPDLVATAIRRTSRWVRPVAPQQFVGHMMGDRLRKIPGTLSRLAG